MSSVSFTKIPKNTISSMKEAIREALDLIDYSFGKMIRNVVIKPNLCYYWDYSTGQTTDPNFVKALIELIREEIVPNPAISIVEADASAMKTKYVFKMLGYEKLAHDVGAKLVNLTEDQGDIVTVTVGNHNYRLKVPASILSADLRINVPKIKYTPRQTRMTCALKNVFGCNPYPRKVRLHHELEEIVVAINKAIRFNLCIVDGNIVSGIQPCRLGLVMASKDSVSIDAAAAEILGLNSRLRYLRLASEEGLGNRSFVPKGVPLDYFKTRYPKQNPRIRLLNDAYKLVVRIGLSKRLGLE